MHHRRRRRANRNRRCRARGLALPGRCGDAHRDRLVHARGPRRHGAGDRGDRRHRPGDRRCGRRHHRRGRLRRRRLAWQVGDVGGESSVPAETHVEQGPLDRNAVVEIVKANLADILEIDPATITEGQSFVDDLDADSLALIELVEALEEELGERSVGFRIEDEDLVDLKTVRDAVDYVFERVKGS
ncbi:MAG: acyl carrier protein [Acidimicrobiaceae bacterium]|nr:acyl carrier protein [Ilumatobacter sp.]MCB9382185.1 acyl carrier protein [Acidimicrobiaceae bacterium]